MSRINNKNKDKNHITSSNRKYNMALVDTYDIHKEYGILDEEEKYLKEKKDQVVPLKDVDNMIKLLCRFHICGIASDLEHFEDIVRDKVSTTEYMAELDDFGGYGSGSGYVDFGDAMHFDLACKLIRRLQYQVEYKDEKNNDTVKYSEILDCMVY
jgi:hypothetical protein